MTRHRHPTPDRPGLDRLRGLLAVLVIAALLLGIPAALLTVAGNPLPGTGLDLPALADRLLATDRDGSLFLGALALIAWIAWAGFALAVTVETLALLRGLPTPHLPALGPQQRTAGILVATAALLFTSPVLSPAALAAAPAPATTAAVTAPLATPAQAPGAPDTAPTAKDTPAGQTRTHTVRPGDTLWSIATARLGDGARFTQIADLNYGAPQPDGRQLRDTHWLTPGWTLTLPADASPDTTPDSSPDAGSRDRPPDGMTVVTVAPGDTLSRLARDLLGEPDRWPDIAAASTGRQSDGTHLSDPDLIRPGWQLHVPTAGNPAATDPAATAPATPTAPTGPTGPTAPTPPVMAAPDGPAAAPPAAAAPPPAEQRPDRTVPDTTVGSTTPAADKPAAGPAHPAADPPRAVPATPAGPSTAGSTLPDPAGQTGQDDQDGQDGALPIRTAGGVGALLAASLLALLGLQRRRQRRRRGPGELIPMPTGDQESLELDLRLTEDPAGLERVDQALRSLALLASRAGLAMPALRMLRLRDTDLELYAGDGTTALPGPFTATADPSVWTLPGDSVLPGAAELAEVPAPYPAMVTLGHDLDGAHVLLDLGHIRSLSISASDDCGTAVLAAIAAELATSRWADDLQVTVVGCLPELPGALATGRVRHAADLGPLLPALEERAASIRRALAGLDTAAAVDAHPAADVARAGTWAPEILLLGAEPTPADRDRLTALLQDLPQVGIAAIGTGAPLGGWELEMNPADTAPDSVAVLSPVSLALRPQQLTRGDLTQLTGLLHVADTDPVATPAPAAHDNPGPVQDTIWLPDAVPPQRHTPVSAIPPAPPGPGGPPTADAPADPGQDRGDAADPGDSGGRELPRAVEPAAAWPPVDAPYVQVLGPVKVVNATGNLEAGRGGQLTEIAAYLALNPGLDHTHLDEAKWPGARELTATRNTAVSKLRRWLGTTPDGQAYVPDVTQAGYRLHPDIRTDWEQWQRLLPNGPVAASTTSLAQALELVRGQPFAGARSRTYAWAERAKQDMIAAIGDAAHELGNRAHAEGDATLARRAAAAGLQADPGAELLWRDALRAEWLAGDVAALTATGRRLIELAAQLGDDLEPETEQLLDELLDPSRPSARVS